MRSTRARWTRSRELFAGGSESPNAHDPAVLSGFCYLAFLVFETFALALDRLSPIRLRGLLEEHPERARILAGAGEIEITRTTTKVLVQALLLTGLLTVVHAFAGFGITPPWAWGGGVFVLGWMMTEISLLRFGAKADPEKIVERLLPTITAASWLLVPLAIPIRRIFGTREKAQVEPATEEEVQAYIDVGREEGILEKGEEKLLMSIVDFGDTRVREVMTPRTDVVSIDEAASVEALADLFVASKYSPSAGRPGLDRHGRRHGPRQGPLRGDAARDGARHGGGPPRGLLRSGVEEGLGAPRRVPAAASLDGDRRRRVRGRVRSRHRGGSAGGDRRRDLRRARGRARGGHPRRRRDAYSVSGKENIATVRELFGRGPEEEEFTTVGGFLAARLGHIPRPGESHRESDLLFTVEEADRRRVHRVRVEAAPAAVAKD